MRVVRSISIPAAAVAVALAATGCTEADTTASTTTTAAASTMAPTTAAVASSSPATTDTAGESSSASASATPTPSATPEAEPSSTPVASPSASSTGTQEADAGTALAALKELAVKGRAPKTGYDREQFGPAWTDTDRNGCDTRNDMLARDLTGETFKPGTHDCVVLTGVLDDPYTATEIHFVRGQDTSNDVQIDHVVSLWDSWQKGAQQLTGAERTEFANDPLNLLAVDGPANAQKSDADAATWLPANKSFRCEFVARQIAVKSEYTLWVTTAEHDAMTQVLSVCPDQVLPNDATAASPYEIETRSTQSPTPTEPYTPTPAPTTQEPTREPSGTDPRFSSCAKAIAAGYGPTSPAPTPSTTGTATATTTASTASDTSSVHLLASRDCLFLMT